MYILDFYRIVAFFFSDFSSLPHRNYIVRSPKAILPRYATPSLPERMMPPKTRHFRYIHHDCLILAKAFVL